MNYSLSVILFTNVVLFLFISFGNVYGIVPPEKSDANYTTPNSNLTKDLCYWESPIAIHFLVPLNGVMFALQQEYYLLSICLITSMFPRIRSIPNVNRNHVGGIGNTDDINQPQAVIKVKQRRQLHIGCKNILMALSSTEVFVPGLVVLIMKETCSFNDGLFFIWPMCVALSLSSVIVVMLSVFYFLRKANKVESISENTNGYLMDNDAIFFLSTV